MGHPNIQMKLKHFNIIWSAFSSIFFFSFFANEKKKVKFYRLSSFPNIAQTLFDYY